MGKGFQGAVLKTLGAKDHVLTVTGKQRLAEHFLRISFHSDTLLDPNGEAPGNWIRAWFPDPDGTGRLFQRGYTLAQADPASGDFAVDFVIHHPVGPASYWASTCEPGDSIVGMRYGEQPFQLLDPPPAGYLFLGDLASYPAIRALAEAVPEQHPVVVYLEQHSPHDAEIPLPAGANVTAAWVEELPDGQGLAQAVAGTDWTGWYAWVTAESLATRRAKTPLQREYGLTRSTLHSQAYWIRGKSMGKSRTLEELNRAEETQTAPGPADAAAQNSDSAPVPDESLPPQDAPASTPAPAEPAPPAERILAPAKTALVAGGAAQALLAVVNIVPFILFAELARLFLRGADRHEFLVTALIALVVMGISALGTSVLLFLMHLYDAGFEAAVRRRLVKKLTALPLGWFQDKKSADVKKLVGDDVAALHYLITHAVLDIVAAVVAPVVTLVYLFIVEWRLAAVLLIPVVVFVAVMARISTRDREKVARSQRYVALASGQAQTFVTTRDQAKVFGTSSTVNLPSTLQGLGDFVAEWQNQTGPAKIQAVMINRPTTVLGLLVLAGWLFSLPGWVTAADLIPFLILGTSFGGQLLGIGSNVGALVTGLEARDGLELLLGTPELAAPARRRVPQGHVRFHGVRFGYTPGRTILHDFDLELAPNSVTALTGPSGAGKSTVAALLARLWDPQAGSVSIDGKDLRDMSAEELYGKVSILLQDVQLVHGTIRENIALTRPDASDEAIEAAARAAHVHEVVEALPHGYSTVVDSSRLSGGERQRIGIARALLADTPVVVLDEATAAADPGSEWAVRQGLDALLKGKTVLMIAHRLHTVRGADRIVVMDDGRMVEDGTHERLLARDGLYAELSRIGDAATAVGEGR